MRHFKGSKQGKPIKDGNIPQKNQGYKNTVVPRLEKTEIVLGS